MSPATFLVIILCLFISFVFEDYYILYVNITKTILPYQYTNCMDTQQKDTHATTKAYYLNRKIVLSIWLLCGSEVPTH